jgi:hypothetical protein
VTIQRQPAGIPTGGRFANASTARPAVQLLPDTSNEVDGHIGMMLAAGQRARTVGGHLTTPFPRGSTDTDRKIANWLRRVDEWLLDNARAEAAARGINDSLLRTLDAKTLTQSDKALAEAILFDQGMRVADGGATSILKPLGR